MELKLNIDQKKIVAFCQKWKVAEFAMFGSVLREDFRPDESDVDVLVDFLPEANIGLFELVNMQDELEAMFGRKVDLVPKRGLKPMIREEVLGSSLVICAAA